MNELIEKLQSIRTVVYAGGHFLLAFPTNQQAYQYLSNLVTITHEGPKFPDDVVIALLVETYTGDVDVPQIGRAIWNEEKQKLDYSDMWGEEYESYRDKVRKDWDTIKESL